MNTYTTLHLDGHNVKFASVLNGQGLSIAGEVGSSVTIFATPEQFLQLADTIYAKHGEYQKEVEQKLEQADYVANCTPEMREAV